MVGKTLIAGDPWSCSSSSEGSSFQQNGPSSRMHFPDRRVSSAAILAQIIKCRNRAESVQCGKLLGNGAKRGLRCSRRTLTGDKCFSHSGGPRCGSVTKMGLPCKNKPVQEGQLCKRHNVDQESSKFEKSIASSGEEEYLAPICKHCKTILLTKCTLCQECEMRALSVVHEAHEYGHSYISNNRSPPSPRDPLQSPVNPPSIEDILPMLKTCRPGDYGMPDIIPVGTNFKVLDRWYVVKDSLIDNADLGLFTVDAIRKGQDLFPFAGPEYDESTWKQIASVLPDIIRYTMYVNGNVERDMGETVYFDGRTRHSNLAGYINSVYGGKDRSPNVNWRVRLPRNSLLVTSQPNVNRDRLKLYLYRPHVMTVAINNIAPGGELYADYKWQVDPKRPRNRSKLPKSLLIQPVHPKRRIPHHSKYRFHDRSPSSSSRSSRSSSSSNPSSSSDASDVPRWLREHKDEKHQKYDFDLLSGSPLRVVDL